MDDDVVELAFHQERVVQDLLEVNALHVRGPLDVRALQRVVDVLCDREELVAAVNDLPFGFDAEVTQQRHVGGEQFGNAASVGRGVHVKDACAAQRLGGRANALNGVFSGYFGVVGKILFQQGDAFEHENPHGGRGLSQSTGHDRHGSRLS